MLVDLLGDPGEGRDVAIVPVAQFDIRRHVAAMMDLHHFRAHYAPAAFRLHAAHGGKRRNITITHAVAMRDLVKAIARRDRADADGLEKDVVTGIASHVGSCQKRTTLYQSRTNSASVARSAGWAYPTFLTTTYEKGRKFLTHPVWLPQVGPGEAAFCASGNEEKHA